MSQAEIKFALTIAWGSVAVRAEQYKANPSHERKQVWEDAYLAWEKLDNQARLRGV